MIGLKFQKKRVLGLFLCVFALGLSPSKAGDTERELYTPRNTQVPDTYEMDEFIYESIRDSLDSAYTSNYPLATQLKLGVEHYSSSRRYNFHGYAWHMIGDDDIDDKVWIGYSGEGEVYLYWTDGSYDTVSSSIATIVKYSGDHSAVTTSHPDTFISKWNWGPLMQRF